MTKLDKSQSQGKFCLSNRYEQLKSVCIQKLYKSVLKKTKDKLIFFVNLFEFKSQNKCTLKLIIF